MLRFQRNFIKVFRPVTETTRFVEIGGLDVCGPIFLASKKPIESDETGIDLPFGNERLNGEKQQGTMGLSHNPNTPVRGIDK